MAGPVPFKFEVAFKFAIGHTKGPSGSLISFEGHFAERCSAHWVHTPGRPAGSHAGGAPAAALTGSLGRAWSCISVPARWPGSTKAIRVLEDLFFLRRSS